MDVLHGIVNKYGGLYLDAEDLPENADDFRGRLVVSLPLWSDQGIPVVWMRLSREQAHLVGIACECGFDFHHCTAGMLMLTRRLVPDAIVPPYASRTIGTGGVVLTADGEILTVLEKYEAGVRPQYWKLPGGMIEPGEHVADGVVREVREETGIETRFEGLLGLRHHHCGQFDTSNIYFICKFTPLSHTITTDRSELARATWMPAREYLVNEHIGPLNRRAVQVALDGKPLSGITLDNYMDGPGAYEVFVPE